MPTSTVKAKKKGAPSWKSRIVGHGEVDPKDLKAHPQNWRIHPQHQREALDGILSEVGWVDSVMVNQTTKNVIDGHARIDQAIAAEEQFVPVTYVKLSRKEEKLVLAGFDPIGAMAVQDAERLGSLLEGLDASDASLSRLLSDMRDSLPDNVAAPDDFPVMDEDLETQYCCPKCGYEWSGRKS